MDNKDLETGNGATHGSTGSDDSHHQELHRLATSNTISPELFERLYLSPRTGAQNYDLRKTFANPTPLALMGFSVGLTPLAAELMGWRGSGGDAQATVGATLYFGGVLLLIAGIGEWILGNTFPFIVFMGYGAHFLTFGTTFIPVFNAISAYNNSNPYATGSQTPTPEFDASFAFYPLALGILSFIFLICSLRTNLIFFLIFVVATMGFGFAAGAFWQLAEGNMALGGRLVVAVGGCFWVAAMLGWYMLLAVMVPTMELPFPYLPIVDLSTKIRAKGAKDKE